MSDLIDRQAAISEIMEDIEDRSLHDDPATPEDFAEGYDEGIRNAAAIVLQMPSAQKYGTWIVSHFGADAKCSECGMYCVDAYDHDRCDQYCRCCGAKMDGLKLEGGRDETN